MVWVKGLPLSAACSVLSGRSMDTVMPDFASVAACFTFTAVIRLTVPFWSSFPQRPQLESCFIQRSKSAFVAVCEDCAEDVTCRLSVRITLNPSGTRRKFMRAFYHLEVLRTWSACYKEL